MWFTKLPEKPLVPWREVLARMISERHDLSAHALPVHARYLNYTDLSLQITDEELAAFVDEIRNVAGDGACEEIKMGKGD